MRVLLIVLGLYFSCFLTAQEHICKDFDHLIENEKRNGAWKLRSVQNEIYDDYDVKYHRFDWNIDPAVAYISGSVTTDFVALEDITQMVFDLAANMQVNEVLFNDKEVTFDRENDYLYIYFGETLPKDAMATVKVTYEGNPKSSGFGAFETNTHDDTPVLWTLSEPYGAKSWWPCKQNLFDKIDSIDTYVTVPNGNRVASNGLLTEEIPVGEDKTTFHWAHRYKIPAYLIAIAATNYEVFSDYAVLSSGDSVEVLNYVYPENLAAAKDAFNQTVEFIEVFSSLFGDYPFKDEKYGHAQFGWGGGMEHQTMSFMGGFSGGLQAHELAHQWFGDKVTCGSWSHIWLNEGFATYLTGISYEQLYGDETFLDWKTGKINRITQSSSGSVYVADTSSVNRIFNGRLTYDKGSMVLHMLRYKLGDEAFFEACRNYLNDPKLAYGYALTDDLQRHFEEASGEDLEEYFEDWYYGQGFPSYEVTYWENGDGIGVMVEQETSHSSVGFFEMPLELKLKGEGKDTLVRLEVEEQGQEFNLSPGFQVQSIEIDPNSNIISANNSVQVTTSVEENQDYELKVNSPFSDHIHIQSDRVINRLSIVDIEGKIIYEANQIKEKRISSGNWMPGTYILIVAYENGEKESRKIIKL